jgi:hypothetical protein
VSADNAVVASIASQLHPLAVEIDTLRTLPGNPRIGDVDAIARSLSQFGQRKPIVANRNGTVVAGNHTLLAARSLGWREIAVVFVDDDERTAHAYALADNRTAELGSYDDEALLSLIESVDDAELLAATAWDDDDIAELVRRIDASSVQLDEQLDPFAVYSRERICDTAFEHYRANGFPYRRLSLLECQQQINQLAATPTPRLVGTTVGYHVADSYHPHRFHGYAEEKRSPIDSFRSDKYLRKTFDLILDVHSSSINDSSMLGALSLVAGSQACSNFRPGFALALYREFCAQDAVVLDASTGYGGRLVGFLASEAATYIGIDPSTATHAGNERLAAELGEHKCVELINQPVEDIDAGALDGRADFAFTSPPYFTKEHYADEETQSFKRYRTPIAWRDGFLVPMLALTYRALRPGCLALVNIADVELRGRAVPLETWTRHSGTDVGFELVEVRRFPMPRAFAANETRDTHEPVFVFRKPD